LDTRKRERAMGMSLCPVRAARVFALVCNRGYKRATKGMGSQVSGGEVLCGCVSVAKKPPPPTGVLLVPFICQEAGVGYTRERGRRKYPYVRFEPLVFLHWLAVGVTNRLEREQAPKSLVAKCCVGA
jgi:hypothetical protein